jgi:hypothetical protein
LAYTKIHADWEQYREWGERPDGTPPLTAANIEHIEQGLVDATSRDSLVRSARGLVAETWPILTQSSTTTLVDANAYFVSVGLIAGETITGGVVAITTAGSAVTLSKVGLYSIVGTSATRVAVSADQATAWESTGLKQAAFTSAYVVPSSGAYYVAVVAKASTTLPTMPRNTSNAVLSSQLGTGIRAFGNLTAQTDLPASATVGNGTPGGLWLGLF